MPLPGRFRLLHSPFNAFLFAPVADEANGNPLSVLSALTRVGVDPWQEAGRLAGLPRDAAVQALLPMIARASGTDEVRNAEARRTATRLVALLPPAGAHRTARTGAQDRLGTWPGARWVGRRLAYLMVGAALGALIFRLVVPWL
jgi:hypothetical protein